MSIFLYFAGHVKGEIRRPSYPRSGEKTCMVTYLGPCQLSSFLKIEEVSHLLQTRNARRRNSNCSAHFLDKYGTKSHKVA